jgi:hypothetical protein
VPSQPECTFDDGECLTNSLGDVHVEGTVAVPESTPAVAEGPKSRYERLENRISGSLFLLTLRVLS